MNFISPTSMARIIAPHVVGCQGWTPLVLARWPMVVVRVEPDRQLGDSQAPSRVRGDRSVDQRPGVRTHARAARAACPAGKERSARRTGPLALSLRHADQCKVERRFRAAGRRMSAAMQITRVIDHQHVAGLPGHRVAPAAGFDRAKLSHDLGAQRIPVFQPSRPDARTPGLPSCHRENVVDEARPSPPKRVRPIARDTYRLTTPCCPAGRAARPVSFGFAVPVDGLEIAGLK